MVLPISATFFDGGGAYNLVGFLIAAVSLMLTIVGLAVGLWQLMKIRNAAESARQSAQDTSREIGRISALVEAEQLLHISQEIITHIKGRDAKSAAMRAMDLRVAASKFRFTPHGRQQLDDVSWQIIVTKINAVHNALEYQNGRLPLTADALNDSRVEISNLCERFAAMSTGLATGAQI